MPVVDQSSPVTDVQQAVPVAGEYRKTATIRASQWWKMGDHPAVREYDDIDGTGNTVPWVDTLEGGHVVTPGDWIATGIQGEHWPIKADVFATTYAPVDPAMDFGEAIDPNASHNRRSRLTEPARKADRSGEGVDHVPDAGKLVEFVAMVSRLTHTGDDGWTPPSEDDSSDIVDSLITQARQIRSLAPDPTHTREAKWKPMDDAPIERFVLVSLADGSEEDVVEAMQYRKDGWKMFGCNGGRSINPVAWMEKPLPFRAALFAGSAQ
jgi:hypothetical protein